jgi:prophage regulatory protein
MSTIAPLERLYSVEDVLLLIGGMSRAWLYKQIRSGSFPRPLKVGGRAVRFRERDISAWQASRPLSS